MLREQAVAATWRSDVDRPSVAETLRPRHFAGERPH
jgi:hypothetical protein